MIGPICHNYLERKVAVVFSILSRIPVPLEGVLSVQQTLTLVIFGYILMSSRFLSTGTEKLTRVRVYKIEYTGLRVHGTPLKEWAISTYC